jgi:cytochrome b561
MATKFEDAPRYTGFAQALHWLIALMILAAFTLALSFDSIPRATRPWWINLHTVTGLLLFALVLLRLVWRMGHQPPPLPQGTSALARRSSTVMHHTLYLLMLVIPVIGIVAYVWHGRVFDFGLFKLDFGVASSKAVYDPAEQAHKSLAFLLVGLAALHALAALWHHFVAGDGLLWRMWPGRR